MYEQLKLLVLEDQEHDQQVIKRALTKASVKEVHFATTLEAVIDLDSNSTFDIILADLNVPDSNGIETYKEIRKKYASTPIIITSGMTNEDIAIEAIEEGAEDFIRKDDIDPMRLSVQLKLAVQRGILNARIKRAEEKAARQSRFKSNFLVQFSHEIRTPLNAIIGNASLLEISSLNEEQQRLLSSIVHGGNRLSSIVNDILDISKIESGKLQINEDLVDLNALISETMDLFSSEASKKGIELRSKPNPKHLFKVKTDSKRLRQILMNLLSNALKFTDAGYVSVSFAFEREDMLMFYVYDTGRGVPESELEKLFTPFLQIDRRDEAIGTGLGLAICRELCELLGGTIGVKANEHGGATFWFKIFVVTSKVPLEAKSQVDEILSISDLSRVVPEDDRICLIADDDPVNRMVISKILQALNFKVTSVNNGAEAVDAAKQHQGFFAIFMDYSMPVMDGVEATKEIRKFNQNIPVIGLTAKAFDEDKAVCFAAGMNVFLTKPVKLSEVKKVTDEIKKNKKMLKT